MIKSSLPPIHLCTGRDGLRPVLHYVSCRDGMAVATDAHVLVWLTISDFFEPDISDWLEGRLVTSACWKYLHELSTLPRNRKRKYEIHCEVDHLVVREKSGFIGFRCPVEREVAVYVNWIQIWNAACGNENKLLESIGWNSSLMDKAVKASGITHELAFQFSGNTKPIIFGGHTPDGLCTYGLIMPVMVSAFTKQIPTITVKYVETK